MSRTGHIHAARIDTASRLAVLWNKMRWRTPGQWIPAPELAAEIGSGCISTDISALRSRLRQNPQPTIHGTAVDVENKMERSVDGNQWRSFYRVIYAGGGGK